MAQNTVHLTIHLTNHPEKLTTFFRAASLLEQLLSIFNLISFLNNSQVVDYYKKTPPKASKLFCGHLQIKHDINISPKNCWSHEYMRRTSLLKSESLLSAARSHFLKRAASKMTSAMKTVSLTGR